jgi:regulator of protease activity HflC (stomatin/prohibitin superfamily)
VATADAVEHAARQVIGETELRALVAERVSALAGVEPRASAVAQEWGVAVLDVDALDVELRTGPELGRLLG